MAGSKRVRQCVVGGRRLRYPRVEEQIDGVMVACGLIPAGPSHSGSARQRLDVELLDAGHSGTWLRIEDDERLARRVGRRLAVALAAPTTVLVVEMSEGKSSRSLQVTGQELLPDGRSRDTIDRQDVDWDVDEFTAGDLFERVDQVVFSTLGVNDDVVSAQVRRYLRRPASDDPKIARVVESIRDARSHRIEPAPDGRTMVVIEHYDGGRETSFLDAARAAALEQALGGEAPR